MEGEKDMKIGILCAGDGETAPFLSLLAEHTVEEKAKLEFYQGKMGNAEVVLVCSGVCKVNAAIAAQILIDRYDCDGVINAGTAGAMDSGLEVFDTVVSTNAVYHDVEERLLREYHPHLPSRGFLADTSLLALARIAAGQLQAIHKTVFGRMATGESFIEGQRREEINALYQPLSVDMETASVAHVCYVNEIPFIAVRTLTDTASRDAKNNFRANQEKASYLSATFVKTMLQALE